MVVPFPRSPLASKWRSSLLWVICGSSYSLHGFPTLTLNCLELVCLLTFQQVCIFPTKQKKLLEVGSSHFPFLLVVFTLLIGLCSFLSLPLLFFPLSIPACTRSSVGYFPVCPKQKCSPKRILSACPWDAGRGLEAVALHSAGFGFVQTFRAAKGSVTKAPSAWGLCISVLWLQTGNSQHKALWATS